jgi:acyl-CoA-binding protein
MSFVKDNEMDRAINRDVAEEKCIENFCGEYQFETWERMQGKKKIKFILLNR